MKWNYVKRRIDELRPQQKNPRKISKVQKEQITSSLSRFGLCQPIVIAKDGTILGGHQRFYILRTKGEKEVGCMEASEDLSPAQVDELTIRLNKNSGSFDFDLLANGYDPQDLINWGFDMEELHLESIPEQTEPPKLCQLTAKFENEDDLRQAELQIAAIIDLYASASYKVKVK